MVAPNALYLKLGSSCQIALGHKQWDTALIAAYGSCPARTAAVDAAQAEASPAAEPE
jgi:hypothetical protein